MSIRIRLLAILLITSLTPLVLTSVTHQISLRFAKQRLAAMTRKSLDNNARLALQELHQSHVALLQRDRQLSEALLTYQAREIESVLSSAVPSGVPRFDQTAATFAFEPNLIVTRQEVHPFFQDPNHLGEDDWGVDYRRQSYILRPNAEPNQAASTLGRLSSLTGLYHKIYLQAPPGVLWISTTVGRDILTQYPAGKMPARSEPGRDPNWRNRPDGPQPPGEGGRFRPPDPSASSSRTLRDPAAPRDPNWPRRGNRSRFNRGFPRSPIPIRVDPITQQWVLTNTVEFSSKDGSVTGSTSLARTIPEVFKDMALPERWGHETEHMLIRFDPNNPTASDAEKLLHDKQTQFQRSGNSGARPPWTRPRLTSSDSRAFAAMLGDLGAGRAGTQLMEYEGRICLWAYQPLDITQVGAILIVPYGRVTELAATLEKSLIDESLFWLQATTGVLLLATLLAVLLAIVKARTLTKPISDLIHAGRQLAEGDYDTQVRILADDEIGQLGRVFNGIGPQLKERETMKESLALAGVIQQSLLPQKTPHLQNFDVAGQCLYCDETGGDYYDFIDLSDLHPGHLSVVLGDVSGHGIGSALVMASVRGIMHSEVKHSACDLVKLLDTINRQVVVDTEVDTFVTLFHGILDDRNRTFIWSSAGHEPAFWLHQAQDEIEELPNTGMPLGITREAVYGQAGPIILEVGDLLVIGSDGIWEARNKKDDFFGKDRFCKILRDNIHATSEAICAAVIGEVTAFVGSGRRTDDITLIVIKVTS